MDVKECTYHSPIGMLKIREEGGRIVKIDIWESQEEIPVSSSVLMRVCDELSEYFDGKRQTFSFPIKTDGTEFQKLVWHELMQVPYGEITTYGELAKKIGRSASARAVGNAVGKNPLLIVIPCHRVCRGDGTLGGFSAGIGRKKALLKAEGIEMEVENGEEI